MFQTVPLDERAVQSFRDAKQVTVTERISSIDFSPYGDTMISGDNNDQIIIYDCDKIDTLKTINVRKYGVDLVRYTMSSNIFVHSSSKVDQNIRSMMISESDVSYLAYYRGHSARVVSLCTSKAEETFISGSLDRTLRLWDLRHNDCIGIMHLSGRPIAAYDPSGRVFAVGVNSDCLKLYNAEMYDKGPFITFKMEREENCEWIDLKFSPDGKVIMINTNGSIIRLIDAFNGTPLLTISGKWIFSHKSCDLHTNCLSASNQSGRQNPAGEHLEASFSPDSQFILSGSADGLLHIWNADTGRKVCALKREKNVPMRCVRFNPKFLLLATADTAVNFWLPTI